VTLQWLTNIQDIIAPTLFNKLFDFVALRGAHDRHSFSMYVHFF
jgi:hypothetical protein